MTAPEHPTNALTPEESEAFERLGLRPGAWLPLYAVPALIRFAAETARFQELASAWFAIIIPESGLADFWQMLPTKLARLVKTWCPDRERHTVESPEESFLAIQRLCGDVPSEAATRSHHLDTALALLAWRLAKDLDATERALSLERMAEAMREDPHNPSPTYADLLARIDEQLPARRFSTRPASSQTPSVEEQLLLCEDLAGVLTLESRSDLITNPQMHEVLPKLWPTPWQGGLWKTLGLLGQMREVPTDQLRARLTKLREGVIERLAQWPLGLRQETLREARLFLSHLGINPFELDDWDTLLVAKRTVGREAPPAPEPVEIPQIPTAQMVEEEPATLAPAPLPVAEVVIPPPPPIAPPMVHVPAPPSRPHVPMVADAVASAEGFVTVPWSQVRAVLPVQQTCNFADARLLFAPREGEHIHIVEPGDDIPACLWFVGDLHGDLLALENAWEHIRQTAEHEGHPPHVVFLGDFVDRGPHSHEVLVRLAALLAAHPGRIAVIPGNHDEELAWDESSGLFRSSVSPAEYVDELNHATRSGRADAAFRVQVGMQAIAFFARCPRAIFFPDGLLAAHGGFPHTDLLPLLKTRANLNERDVLQDFTWLRLSMNSPRKRPNRMSRGCEFGYDDFFRFCDQMTTSPGLGVRVERLIRGHDHIPERYLIPPRYKNRVVTINTMCRRLEDEIGADAFPQACIARYVSGKLPLVRRMPIAPEEVKQAFAAPVERTPG